MGAHLGLNRARRLDILGKGHAMGDDGGFQGHNGVAFNARLGNLGG
jgi:hypothetical protein